jgi:hypothetical protein
VFSWLFGSKTVQTRLNELEQSVNTLRSSVKGIEGEWETTYRKMHALRVSLRRQLPPETDDVAPEPTIAKVADIRAKAKNGEIQLGVNAAVSDHEMLRKIFG